MRTKVLIVGGSGQLGSELQRQGQMEWEIFAPNRLKLNAFQPDSLAEAVAAYRPGIVVNCSAFHVVDLCETQFSEALAVNAVAVLRLAQACQAIGARFLTVSTDYAFDGTSRAPYTEEDAANPIQAYGISKVAGERAALSAHPEGALVVRSCGLYGHSPSRQKGGNFVLNRIADSNTKSSVEVGCDLVCTPTSASDLAAAIISLLKMHATAGLYHLTNSGNCDWATFTAEIYRCAGLNTQVIAKDRGGRYAPARRPAFTVLNGGKAAMCGVVLRPWQDALSDYVASLD